ncbi:MAG: hypothetical protein FIA93_05300 [Deltaproteobacteria bacterium]|nr:hypothetical protein [Deltaproteobacteria bacterium]PWB62975.1 MAG: hypothetical protein C3F14_09015 [Deltaproteobacteria bacterium]
MEDETRKIKVSLTEDPPAGEGVRGSIQNFIMGLSVPEKVELAGKGNKEVREILSRDPNRMVARAVMSSPRLTDADVGFYAAAAQTNEEILRAIGENREYMSNSNILLALVSNPRTPAPVALRHLSRLKANELGIIGRNRSVSALVRQEAKRLLLRKR